MRNSVNVNVSCRTHEGGTPFCKRGCGCPRYSYSANVLLHFPPLPFSNLTSSPSPPSPPTLFHLSCVCHHHSCLQWSSDGDGNYTRSNHLYLISDDHRVDLLIGWHFMPMAYHEWSLSDFQPRLLRLSRLTPFQSTHFFFAIPYYPIG